MYRQYLEEAIYHLQHARCPMCFPCNGGRIISTLSKQRGPILLQLLLFPVQATQTQILLQSFQGHSLWYPHCDFSVTKWSTTSLGHWRRHATGVSSFRPGIHTLPDPSPKASSVCLCGCSGLNLQLAPWHEWVPLGLLGWAGTNLGMPPEPRMLIRSGVLVPSGRHCPLPRPLHARIVDTV